MKISCVVGFGKINPKANSLFICGISRLGKTYFSKKFAIFLKNKYNYNDIFRFNIQGIKNSKEEFLLRLQEIYLESEIKKYIILIDEFQLLGRWKEKIMNEINKYIFKLSKMKNIYLICSGLLDTAKINVSKKIIGENKSTVIKFKIKENFDILFKELTNGKK